MADDYQITVMASPSGVVLFQETVRASSPRVAVNRGIAGPVERLFSRRTAISAEFIVRVTRLPKPTGRAR